MATSPVLGITLPNTGGTDQVPADMMTAFTQAELYFVGRFASSSDRDAKITSPTGGETAWLVSPGKFTYYDATLAAWADLMNPNAWDSFTPTLRTTSGTAVVVGSGGTQVGRYRLMGKTCSFQATWTFQSGFNGGTGQLVFNLPPGGNGANVSGLGQTGPCSLYVPSTAENYSGFWTINPGNSYAEPHFPKSSSTSAMTFLQNSTDNAAGEGVPNIAGSFPLQAGGQLTASGSYQTA